MDQDFHYYGTYYAARAGGFEQQEASLIAKAANFIDFFHEEEYAAYWKLVLNTEKSGNYQIAAELDYPRYTYQGGLLGSGLAPEDGLWCSYHFPPGNYDDPPNTPTRETVHGESVANYLPKFATRDTDKAKKEFGSFWSKLTTAGNSEQYLQDLRLSKLLNRPQSALSRQLIMDAVNCAANDARLESILGYAIGGEEILRNNRNDNLRRFKLILLGIRAHVIADTWAHQDFCGLHNVMNTYWDVNYDPSSWSLWKKGGFGRQAIQYDDSATGNWQERVLSVAGKANIVSRNFEAPPNGTSYLGHGWMGHFPDFSFVKFRYKPCWADPSQAIERDNPKEYKAAWIELVSLFTQASGNGQLKLSDQFENSYLRYATESINHPFNLDNKDIYGRKSSADKWRSVFPMAPPLTDIDVNLEPDKNAVLDGMLEKRELKEIVTGLNIPRYGEYFININSDLYLFQIAADYHFHFVKNYLQRHNILQFTGSWSQQTSALSSGVSSLFSF